MNSFFQRAVLLACAIIVNLPALSVFAAAVTRGPYLQEMSASSVIVRWRTDTPTDAVVRYGLVAGTLDMTASDVSVGTEHQVLVTGLDAQTDYFYSIGDAGGAMAGDGSYVFKTAPASGSGESTRIWVLGDSGTADANAAAVRDAYKTYVGADGAEVLLMLGDNAYVDGTDLEYQAAVFDMYPEILRKVPLWSTLGNHDGFSADSTTQTGPYFDIFNFPDNAQLGGIASGTEAYYSFEYSNIHFVVLDSFDSDRSTGSAMLTWLENDLTANTKDWVIAFWHHPPYSRGSQNSDFVTELIEMRTNAVPILESYGVDLVLGGHSHDYERSFLLNGHYGDSDSLLPIMVLDGGDGLEGSDGPYQKPAGAGVANQGAVYIVAGSSGKISGGLLNHPAMYVSLNVLGSMILDVDDQRLDAVFLNSTGQVDDSFTIVKGAITDTTPPELITARALSETQVELTFSEALDVVTAEDLANYSIDLGVIISDATYSAMNGTVTLTTSNLILGLTYTLTINNVADTSGNSIAVNTMRSFEFVLTQKFQNGVLPESIYAGARDTYLSSLAADDNFGGNNVLLLDGDDPPVTGNDLYSLIAWDLTGLPVNAIITEAHIDFSVINTSDDSFEVYQILRPWGENSATWNQADTGVPWETAGAVGVTDRGADVLGTLSAAIVGRHTIVLNAQGVAVVQAWVDGNAANHGFVIANSVVTDGMDLRSSDYAAVVADRPMFTVVYTLPPPPVDTDGDGVTDDLDNCLDVANPSQADADGDDFGTACDADFDNNCVVNFLDFDAMTEQFPGTDPLFDLAEDGVINFLDIAIFGGAFLGVPGPSSVVSCP